MKHKNIWLWSLFLVILLSGVQSFSAPIPDTGQTTCYDDGGNIINPCPLSGEDFYGQDANYTINPPSFTKLDSNGNELPRFSLSWAMVRDNNTGLTWEMKTDDGSDRDKDNKYTWQGALDYCEALDLGGHTDWRLPTVQELTFLANYGEKFPEPAVYKLFFPNTVTDNLYWSSTTDAHEPKNAWGVYFSDGHDSWEWNEKIVSFYVRAVRGGQSSSAFIDNGDGTITDTSTGLMWQKGTGAGNMTWQAALAYCEDLELPAGGFTDWRLPTINELRSLVDFSRYDPSINTTFFPNTVTDNPYWSSTSYAGSAINAWSIYFKYGADHWDYKLNSLNVRAVRGGQPGSSFVNPISWLLPLLLSD